ncbi:MAG TPA: PadR family transcriptional regulator [Bryobacteraceae bacterium]|nr:PadR family transcriptional regulator [Bryobacteraceae bacterium]
MAKHPNDRLQGTLDLLVLKSLASRGTLHGYAITVHIQSIAGDALRVEEGSLYPALHRMAQDGWISAKWGTSENNRRARYYTITPEGLKQLANEERRWAELTDAVGRVLRFA